MGFFREKTTEAQGRFADAGDFERAGFFKKGGLYIGQAPTIPPRKMFYNGQGSVIVVGKQEVGKTTSLVIPNLLSYERGSVVVTDPKGVLLPQTARHRRENLGNRIVVLSPWADELKDALGYDIPDDGFNPLAGLHLNDPALFDKAASIANVVCPVPLSATENSKFFKQGAQGILTGLMLLQTARSEVRMLGSGTTSNASPQYRRPTLPELYRMVHSTYDEWGELAQDMENALQNYGIDLTDYAKKILAPMKAEKQFAGMEQELVNALKIYNPQTPLGQHVTKDGFDPDDLKREKITVYIVCPQNRREENKDWLAMVTGMCAESVCKPGKSSPVLFLLEEFANLGYMQIGRYMAEGREAGLQAHLTVQSETQLHDNYGKNGLQLFLDLCAIKQFLIPDDVQLGEMISRYIGKHEAVTRNGNGDVVRREMIDVIRPDQLLRLKGHEQIILTSGETPAALAWIKPYHKDRLWNYQCDENPMLSFPKGQKPLLIEAQEQAAERMPDLVKRLKIPRLGWYAIGLLLLALTAWIFPAIGAAIVASLILVVGVWFFYWKRPSLAFWRASHKGISNKPPLLKVNLSNPFDLLFQALFLWFVIGLIQQATNPQNPWMFYYPMRWMDQIFGTGLVNWWFFS